MRIDDIVKAMAYLEKCKIPESIADAILLSREHWHELTGHMHSEQIVLLPGEGLALAGIRIIASDISNAESPRPIKFVKQETPFFDDDGISWTLINDSDPSTWRGEMDISFPINTDK